MTKKTLFKIHDMHCTSCALNIDFELEDTAGVKKSNTDYAKALCFVEFDPEKVTEEIIISVIKNAGYISSVYKD